MPASPIVLIDDDIDDLELIREAFSELNSGHEIISFTDGYKFLEYMRSSGDKPYFILCDINMGKMDGMSLKHAISNDDGMRLKCVPFLFFSTSQASSTVAEAYNCCAQGYFIKPNSLSEMKLMFESMINYWKYAQHPIPQARSFNGSRIETQQALWHVISPA